MALSATNPASLEEILNTNSYLKGNEPTSIDATIFSELEKTPPTVQEFPHLWSWFSFINQFAPIVRSSWPAPQEETDDFDLFAEDAEAEEQAKKVQEELAQNKPKGPPVGKSNVIFGVKPRYTSVDLDSLATRIKGEISLEGLSWTEEYKKEPVAFGIEMLAIGCVVTDDVETEMIIEEIKGMKGDMEIEKEDDEGEPTGEKEWVFEKLAQSVDILVFQKI